MPHPDAPPLERFLSDGRLEIDSNTVERAIRSQNHHKKKCALCGQPWRRPDLGDHRHASADREDERCRSARLAHANSRADRAGLADLSNRSSHALALQSLNGLSLALTVQQEPQQRSTPTTASHAPISGADGCLSFRSRRTCRARRSPVYDRRHAHFPALRDQNARERSQPPVGASSAMLERATVAPQQDKEPRVWSMRRLTASPGNRLTRAAKSSAELSPGDTAHTGCQTPERNREREALLTETPVVWDLARRADSKG
ncbi:hypothetical protein ACVJ5M_008808 [Bradyrhizobium sp. S3.7.6]